MVDRNITNLFNEMYDSTNQKVLSYITAKCGRTSEIADIFQETYLEVYAALRKHGVDYVNKGEAFVMKIARQKVSRYYSFLDKVKPVIPMLSSDDEEKEVNIVDLEKCDLTFEDEESERALISQVKDFLKRKPRDVQKIFILFYYLDKTIPEIAKLLSMSESGVKNKLYRTLKELRQLYDKDGVFI